MKAIYNGVQHGILQAYAEGFDAGPHRRPAGALCQPRRQRAAAPSRRRTRSDRRAEVVAVKATAPIAVDELRELSDALDETQLETVATILVDAARVFFTGIGRSGPSARAVAMRLMRIGKLSFAGGEVATPAIADGGVLVAVGSRGRGSILDQARPASELGARNVSLTADKNEMTELSDAFIAVPARSTVSTTQHAGSLFEQGFLLVGDALCREVQSRLDVPTSELNARHADIL